MNNPVLPVAATWIRPINPTERFTAHTPLSNVPDSDLIAFDHRIAVIGVFGLFLTITFESRLYVVPAPMVQGLLWSFDENLGHQFSDEEQRLLVGACGKAEVLAKLDRELTNLCQWLQSPLPRFVLVPTPLGAAGFPVQPDQHHDRVNEVGHEGCPEPMFFLEEGRP